MDVSVTGSSSEIWLLPFAPGELASALAVMARAMTPAGGGAKPAALELSLLDDPDMARLNAEFLGLSGPTNVLAFPAAAGGGAAGGAADGASVGSLALAVQTVLREARLYGQQPGPYTLKMLAHGLAHILGYDHGEKMDIEVKRGAQSASMALNVGKSE